MNSTLTLPLQDPVLVFTLILLVILLAPILLEKIKVPSIIGLIVAGVAIGPHGFNLIERNSAVVLFGTIGLLYIMFLAGLEIDLAEFRKNRNKSLGFGFFSFAIPMILGTVVFYYIFEYALASSILVASMFASHTLITYPIVHKFDITKNPAVNITVGGTLIVNLAALLILAVIVGSTSGSLDTFFWIKLSSSIVIFSLVVLLVFPRISRWFFKRQSDSTVQYIFVLVVVFVSSFLAIIAGIEAIIGAFLAGFALNKLIARNSPLMSQIDFVGNTLFIPIFLIGVGMLVNYKILIGDAYSLLVAVVMSVVATVAKYLAAVLTQKTFKLSRPQMVLMFGLSNSQAASTLAAVLIGYNIIIGQTADGEAIRLLDENILNGTILMILVTCTIASFATQAAAAALAKEQPVHLTKAPKSAPMLVGLSNESTVESLLALALNAQNRKTNTEFYGLHIITADKETPETLQRAESLIHKAEKYAAAANFKLQTLLRYDLNIAAGIINTVKEKNVRHFFIGLHEKSSLLDTFFGNLTNDLLEKNPSTIYIYKSCQPINTIKNFALVLPPNAELEIGFNDWYQNILQLTQNISARLDLFLAPATLLFIKKHHLLIENMTFHEFSDLAKFAQLKEVLQPNTLLIVNLARKGTLSYQHKMTEIKTCLSTDFKNTGFLLIYPHSYENAHHLINYTAFQENIEDFKNLFTKVTQRRK